ncbi:hypothetical protein BaRGS_00011057, partial [Batillaria attramentaria]
MGPDDAFSSSRTSVVLEAGGRAMVQLPGGRAVHRVRAYLLEASAVLPCFSRDSFAIQTTKQEFTHSRANEGFYQPELGQTHFLGVAWLVRAREK